MDLKGASWKCAPPYSKGAVSGVPAVPAAAAAARLKTSKEARESGCGGGGAVPKIRTGLQLSCTQLHTLHAIPVPVFL